jgi:hypothetical protein
MRPSDWYITLLNDIDERLTEENLVTKVVFLLYVDLLWEPQQVKLNNPDRFTLMFAPITRTYSSSFTDAPAFDENDLPDFELNKLKFPIPQPAEQKRSGKNTRNDQSQTVACTLQIRTAQSHMRRDGKREIQPKPGFPGKEKRKGGN